MSYERVHALFAPMVTPVVRNQPNAVVLFVLVLLLAASASTAATRTRVIATSDIAGGDRDDHQSWVHLMLYADVLDIRGFVPNPWNVQSGGLKAAMDGVEAYRKDYPMLRTWSELYPHPDTLKARVKWGFEAEGEPVAGRSTAGSRLIVSEARANDPRPLWILVWGKMPDVAQALCDAPDIAPKLRIYSIGTKENWNTSPARDWIARTHPTIFWVENDAAYEAMYAGGDQSGDLSASAFFEANIRGHGALGQYLVDNPMNNGGSFWLKAGDTPSTLYLLGPYPGSPANPRGIQHNPENPGGESWGGVFVRQHDNYWLDNGSTAGSIAGWRRDFLYDFKARLDRTITRGSVAARPRELTRFTDGASREPQSSRVLLTGRVCSPQSVPHHPSPIFRAPVDR